MVKVNIGPEGRKFIPFIFALFTFILVSNLAGLLPLAVIPGAHPFTTTSQFSLTGVLAVLSFSIVLIVGFWRHGLHFFSLFVPHGTPAVMHAVVQATRRIPGPSTADPVVKEWRKPRSPDRKSVV